MSWRTEQLGAQVLGAKPDYTEKSRRDMPPTYKLSPLQWAILNHKLSKRFREIDATVGEGGDRFGLSKEDLSWKLLYMNNARISNDKRHSRKIAC